MCPSRPVTVEAAAGAAADPAPDTPREPAIYLCTHRPQRSRRTLTYSHTSADTPRPIRGCAHNRLRHVAVSHQCPSSTSTVAPRAGTEPPGYRRYTTAAGHRSSSSPGSTGIYRGKNRPMLTIGRRYRLGTLYGIPLSPGGLSWRVPGMAWPRASSEPRRSTPPRRVARCTERP